LSYLIYLSYYYYHYLSYLYILFITYLIHISYLLIYLICYILLSYYILFILFTYLICLILFIYLIIIIYLIYISYLLPILFTYLIYLFILLYIIILLYLIYCLFIIQCYNMPKLFQPTFFNNSYKIWIFKFNTNLLCYQHTYILFLYKNNYNAKKRDNKWHLKLRATCIFCVVILCLAMAVVLSLLVSKLCLLKHPIV
jgi:hypothetical protein